VCVIVVCMPSPLYLAARNPCMSVPFFIRNVILKKKLHQFHAADYFGAWDSSVQSLYLASFSPCMCVRAVSISLYKNMQLILPIGCRRAAFPIALLGATELSLELHAFREARRELGRAVSFNQPDMCRTVLTKMEKDIANYIYELEC